MKAMTVLNCANYNSRIFLKTKVSSAFFKVTCLVRASLREDRSVILQELLVAAVSIPLLVSLWDL